MPLAAYYPGASWTAGVLTVLDSLGGTRRDGLAQCAPNNGGFVAGYTTVPAVGSLPSKWIGAAASGLDDISPGNTAAIIATSRDGSGLLGTVVVAGNTVGFWPSDGSTGKILVAGGDGTGSATEAETFNPRILSDNGLTAVGRTNGASSISPRATKWNTSTGTPTLLNYVLADYTVTGTGAKVCDGTAAVIGGFFSIAGGVLACFWDAGTIKVLLVPVISIAGLNTVKCCLRNGTVLYGNYDNRYYYWDSLATVTMGGFGAGPQYGVSHALATLPGGTTTFVRFCAPALVSGVPVAVGTADAGSNSWATRWRGTTATNLGGLPGGTFSDAYGCDDTGNIVVGQADDSGGIQRAVWWDAANTIHLLPDDGDDGSFAGIVYGISGDASILFGQVFIPAPPDPPAVDVVRLGALRRTQLPKAPNPSDMAYRGDIMKWQRATYEWMMTVKARLETDSTVNTRPIGPLQVGTYTMVSTVTGTDDLSNFVATLVALMQGHGYTVPFDLRTNT